MATVPLLLARRFSTGGASNQLVKAPLQVFGIEGRYASALYSAASKQKQLEVVEKELNGLQKALSTKGKIVDFMLNPSLKRGEKKDVMKSAMEKAKASALTSNLLAVLAENGRLNKLPGIVNVFSRIMSAHRGEVECQVVTAKELDAAMKKELETALKSFVKSGTIIMRTSVDPSIIGGMVVSIGDKYVDMSTASKIKKYTSLIEAAV